MKTNSPARLLPLVMDRFGVDPEVRRKLPSVVGRMEVVCDHCPAKSRCRRALAEGYTKGAFWDFCPNAARLESVHVIGR